MGKLVVVDDEYGELKAALGSFGDVVEEQVTEYLRILAELAAFIASNDGRG